jgi:hypothetical protein
MIDGWWEISGCGVGRCGKCRAGMWGAGAGKAAPLAEERGEGWFGSGEGSGAAGGYQRRADVKLSNCDFMFSDQHYRRAHADGET